VAMMHTNKRDKSKILKSCTLPLTGVNCVTRVVTNMAVLDVKNGAFRLVERAPGVSVEEIQAATEGTLIVEGESPEMVL
jgi:3-oxoacid CoA-transferase subunit B